MGTAVQPNQRVEKRHGKLTILTSGPRQRRWQKGLRGFPAKPSHAADKPSMSLTWMYA